MIKTVDINSDMGEGVGNEHLLMPYISSCSIACGGHAGDEKTMREIVEMAVRNHVKIGAHPSYPDKENFGRKSIKISSENLIKSIRTQIESLTHVLETFNVTMFHIKPHGALYNDIAGDQELAHVFLRSIINYKDQCMLYAPFGSMVAKIAIEGGFKVKYEAFADRNYNEDLSLVQRSENNALITDSDQVLQHVLRILENNQVKSITCTIVPIKADTLCVHSDTENAVDLVKRLYERLIIRGFKLGKIQS